MLLAGGTASGAAVRLCRAGLLLTSLPRFLSLLLLALFSKMMVVAVYMVEVLRVANKL